MHNFIKRFSLLFLMIFSLSCSEKIVKKESVDIYSETPISVKQANYEIEKRTIRIKEINENINKIEDYNKKMKEKIELDNSYNSYNESLNKTYYKNIEIINSMKNEIELLNTEIRVINRRAE